ncbi:MAG: cytidine deaminase [Candidatus Melainabacteria bacterium RIFOXYA12_FULL_32_12]|nr:MAG: cytidine deaminase [Candidatus Melainabacteria bacterium RIFOXYA2_FULL_32_9]OGI31404.1 MAG: cytidine deaminase [Candidatus Melainabacteria bacterium RIFOXYA12_FULL_32_12]
MQNIDPNHLLKLASKAAENAHAPYSKFNVGACALFEDGSIYKGCNVENASYGLTLCAERNAISTAITEGKKAGLVAIAIYSPNSKLCYPCGACRQWIAEFSKDALIIVEDSDGTHLTYTISELLPKSFTL